MLLAVPFMGSPLRVQRALRFNMNPAGTVVASNPLNSTHVDIHQHPDVARREIIKHGPHVQCVLGERGGDDGARAAHVTASSMTRPRIELLM